MINVGITGTFSAINRHIYALNKMEDIRITGRWITGGSTDGVIDMESGKSFADPENILGKADAWIITDSGNFNNRLATVALRKARHVFLHPSVIRSINDVYQLIKLAREANVILKCAKTGKFGLNGLLRSIPDLNSISMVELQHGIKISKSIHTFTISEILLGDIEIVNSLIKARNTFIKAKGLCMFTPQPEIISARLEFDNGSVVNYHCNAVGTQNEHMVTIMLKDSVLRYSFINNELSGWFLKHTLNQNENPIFIENIQVEQTDNLSDDLCGFFNLIHSGPAFLSIYDNGFETYVLTDRILEKVGKTLVQFA